MTWKGTLRSIEAASRRIERDAQRRQRELVQQARTHEKMEQLEQAAYEVEVYENRIDLLRSVHKECGDSWDWDCILAQIPPEPPTYSTNNEKAATGRFHQYKPGIFDRLLGRVNSKLAVLKDEIEAAKEKNKSVFRQAMSVYEDSKIDVEEARQLAGRILDGDTSAYLEAIEETDPFADISALGSALSFNVANRSTIEVTLHVNDEAAVPSEVKSLLQRGKLSIRKMPKGAFNELYQDYICSCAFRVARETLYLLPIEMVIVNAMGNILNSKTGHMEEQPILSVAIPRDTIDGLNLDTIDPSDSMGNFVHNMDFKKTTDFRVSEKIDELALQ